MVTCRMLRLRMTGLGLALCAAMLGGCQTPTLHFDELPTGWQHDKENGAFLPPGETFENWTEKVELTLAYRPFFAVVFGGSTPDKWMSEFQESLRKKHPENTVSTIRKAPDGILFEGVEKGKAGKPDEKFVGRLLDRQASRFLLWCYARSPKDMTPSRRTRWIDWLLKARVQ